MGRRAEGFRIEWRAGWAYVRFTFATVPYRVALGTKDSQEAASEAARTYAEVVSGRRRAIAARGQAKPLGLKELWAEWIASREGGLDPRTVESLEMYGRRFVDYFETLDRITEASGEDYGNARLRQVTRSTALKELIFLRQFLAWCKRNGILGTTPVIPPLAPRAHGKRSGPQRQKSVDISGEEAQRIIALLPEESKTIDGRTWPIRARFLVAWETGLRPATLSALSVPEHYRRGAKTLTITDDIDKARFAREVDLTPVAQQALKECCPKQGLLFGHHCFNKALKRAAKAVLGPARGKNFAAYDFRHGRANDLLDNGASLRGVAWVMGHKRLSTTDKYLKADRRLGQHALKVAQ